MSRLQVKTSEADAAVADLAAALVELSLVKEEVRKRDELRPQLEAVLASKTWRLTAPLRHFVSKTKIYFARGSHEGPK